jgi:hypothetical protein
MNAKSALQSLGGAAAAAVAEHVADSVDSTWSVDIAPEHSDDEVMSKRLGAALAAPALDYGIPDDGQVRCSDYAAS